MNSHQEVLDLRLRSFRKKYYVDRIIRGGLLLLLITTSILFVVLLSEGLFGFSKSVRTGLVIGLGAGFVVVLAYMVLWPFSQWLNLSKSISDFQIAKIVQGLFPEINDKLVNVLQLRRNIDGSNELAAAAVEYKASEIAPVKLEKGINLKLNRKYLWYLLIPLSLFLITYLINPALISGSSHRLINYNQKFEPPAPFSIQFTTDIPEEIVAGQDLEIAVNVDGNELPAELFIFLKKDSEDEYIDYNLSKENPTAFTYTIAEAKEDFSFYIGNPEVRSEPYTIKVIKRPFIRNFKVQLIYPKYTKLGIEMLDDNIGDFKAIKGTTIKWIMEAQGEIEEAQFVSEEANDFKFNEKGKNFSYSRRLMDDLDYFLSLKSTEQIYNIDTVRYQASVLQDRFPSIYVFSPTNDFKVELDPNLPLDLEIADDFGFSKMSLFYRFTKSGGTSATSESYKEYPLDILNEVLLQPQSYNIDLTQLGLKEGDHVEYFIKVWDNDGVSGAKASTSPTYNIIYPTLAEKYDEVEKEQDEFKEDLEDLADKAEDLEEAYKKVQEKLLEDRKLSFDDKKELQELLDEHQQLMKEMENTQENFEDTKNKMDQNNMVSEETLEQYEELNEYLEEMNNPEIEDLLKELSEQLENLDPEDLKEKLDQLQMNDEDIKKSLERTLELFKQLEVQQKIDELKNKLDNMQAKEEILNEKLEEAKTAEELDENAKRQEELKEQMKDLQKDMDKLEDLKDDTRTPDEELMDELNEDASDVGDEMDKAKDQTKEAADKLEGKKKGDKNEKGDKNQEGEKGEQNDEASGEKNEESSSEKSDEQSEKSEAGEQQQGEEQEQQEQKSGKKDKKGSKQAQQNASQSQKKAAQKLGEMSEKLSSMQMQMQQQQDQQNLESLRELLENLLTLSFDQEDLRDEVKDLSYGDPALGDKSKDQKKLQDDMSLINDSLEALSRRIVQMQKPIMDESKTIIESMEKSQRFFRNKQVPVITYHQQTAMTSVNNLANMLSNLMQQIQQQMMNGMPGAAQSNEPGEQPGQMQMRNMAEQQRMLNQQLRDMLQKGQMNGEALAEMAARQKAIREKLQQAMQQMKENGESVMGDMGKVSDDMKQSEQDLMEKQLNAETLFRQQQILNRLLQADRSIRERDWDKKRESKSGRELEQADPDALSQEELKNRIRQELLKSNKLEYSNDFIILIEKYFKKLEGTDE